VPQQKFSFEGLEPIERRILNLADEVAYLVLYDRTNRHSEEKLGRLDLNEGDTLPWRVDRTDLHHRSDLEAVAAGADDDDEPADPWEGDEAEDEDGGERAERPRQPGQPRQPIPMRVLAEAGCRWVREMARSNTVGEPWLRLRLRVYAPKGDRMLFSGQFVCRNHGVDLDIPTADELPKIELPKPSFDEASLAASAKGVKALGDFYAQWGHLVLGSMSQLQGVNNSMLSKLHGQLQESRDQIDMLVASILEHRVKDAERTDQRRAEERQGDARHELAKEAINQLGGAAQAFLVAKGVTPEMAELLGTLSASPELMETLKKPAVRELMQEPGNLASLAAMLDQAAVQVAQAQQQAQGQAPGAQPPPGPGNAPQPQPQPQHE
jgi:hypothetical protein